MTKKSEKREQLEYDIERWKNLRRATEDHNLMCPCSDCSNRRKLGAKFDMPYAGAVTTSNTKYKKSSIN